MNIKILIGYHKKDLILKDSILTPIHLGREIFKQKTKDGFLSNSDYNFMCENMLGDDFGDNISNLNRYFCELTGIYWAWKNYNVIGDPDYIGFMHYRRHFYFNLDCDYIRIERSHVDRSYYTKNYQNILFDLLKKYDVITTKPFSSNQTVKWHYMQDVEALQWGHIPRDFDLLINIIKNDFPQYEEMFHNYIMGNIGYAGNLFIMKKEIFFEYCDYLFNIVFRLHHMINYNYRNTMQIRSIGYIGERLTGAFLNKIDKIYKVKHLTRYDIVKEKKEKIIINNSSCIFNTDKYVKLSNSYPKIYFMLLKCFPKCFV
ncbi:TPA: DUF4422 domain-containing protein, partial [Campylobacter lari]|nr:DUF4422 domain-containing protein [Campylobacter lari]